MPNLLEVVAMLRIKLYLEQCRQVMLQLHLNIQQFYSVPSCVLYYTDQVWLVILCHLPPYKYGSRVPKPGYAAKPCTQLVVSRDPYWYCGGCEEFWQNIINLYYSTDFLFVFISPLCSYWHSVSEGGHAWQLKVLVIRSTTHQPQLPNHYY